MQIVRHDKLNRPDKPCNPSPGYSFIECVEKSIMERIGCQPPWRKYNVKGLPLCDNRLSLSHYEKEYRQTVSMLDRNGLSENTKCTFPCSFLEYKVSCDLVDILTIFCLCQHATDDRGPYDVSRREVNRDYREVLESIYSSSEGRGGLLLPLPGIRLRGRAGAVCWI